MEARKYLHPLREYECGICDSYYAEEVPMIDPANLSVVRLCIVCKKVTTFQRIFSPTYMTFGLYTKKYTGQECAVKGWGTHGLDYSNPKSDLISGRATEAAMNNPGKIKS